MVRSVILAVGAFCALIGSAPAQRRAEPPSLSSFTSDAELRRFLRAVALRSERENASVVYAPPPPSPPPPPPPPPPPASGNATQAAPPSIVVTSARAADAITNTQVAGVDEGGIVKLSGETLVILRRGRLFTVSLAGGGMRPTASINAYPPGVSGAGDWYDEMLLSGDRVVVIGYSYARGGTEVNRFRLGQNGSLTFQDSTQLRSNDYYSSRNYASRLIGTKLVYYTPLALQFDRNPLDALPAIRAWSPGGRQGSWRRVVTPQRVFIPQRMRDRPIGIDTVHSVTTCDLAAPAVSCTATAVLGTESRTFFVSTNAVYIWSSVIDDERDRGPVPALLYRLPLDVNARPQAVGVRGAPLDQFSFSPDEARGALNVLVGADGDGDAMWRPEASSYELALARIPMSAFGNGDREVPLDRYQPIPGPNSNPRQNRFVGDHLMIGADGVDRLTVVGVGDRRITQLPLPHPVSRLDAMGADGIVVGEGKSGLGFSTIRLGQQPARTDTFLLPAAKEGESRSHAFFFRPDTPDGRSGLLGLPVARNRMEGTRYLGASSALQFLARADGRLADAGDLAASGIAQDNRDDGCAASCVDWYGNARPIFWHGRVFALMGYELVEGREQARRVLETGRISFAPNTPRNR